MSTYPQIDAFTGGPGLIQIVGHRGARGVMPENTMEGFAFTLDCGVRLLEFDVAVSKDGVPVITHNHHLTGSIVRNPDGSWLQDPGPKISTLSWESLSQFNVGGLDGRSPYGERFPDQAFLDFAALPPLADLCQLISRSEYQGVHMLLEIKSDPEALNDQEARRRIVLAVAEVLREYGVTSRTIMHSFDWALLEHCQELAPEMPTSFLSQLPDNEADKGEDPATEPGLLLEAGNIPALVKERGGKIWCPYYLDLTQEDLLSARALGLRVAVWTVNETEDIQRMIDLGVDAIVTDYPGRVQRMLLNADLDWRSAEQV